MIGTTIDKYAYISCRYLPPFFDHKYRITYSKIENKKNLNDIEHPSVRECIRFLEINNGLEVHHDSDLPARSGLGSSSTFTVGLLRCLKTLIGKSVSKKRLAKDAIYVEQVLINESVGNQDQVHAAFGGFNHIEFFNNGNFKVNPIIVDPDTLSGLNEHLLLFYTGINRFASDVASEQIKRTPDKQKELCEMQGLVTDALKIINGKLEDIDDFGHLLHETWKLKRSLTDKITNKSINAVYDAARASGALGGKLLGAGGGGFILFFAKPAFHNKIKEKLKPLLYVPFNFENQGSEIVFSQPEEQYGN